jgi:hypothetical protein
MLSSHYAFAFFVISMFTMSLTAYHIRPASKVVDLSAKDIMNRSHALYKGPEWWLIKFYKPDCGASVRLAPEWEEFAEDQLEDEEFVVARFDCRADDKAKKICQNQNKIYYPDITLFRHGQFVGQLPFQTDANIREILSWARPLKQRMGEEFRRIENKQRKQRGIEL